MPTTVLITGCSRGLGLEWVRQTAERGWRVLATCRNDPDDAGALRTVAEDYAAISLHRLDVTDADSIGTLADQLAGTPIDLLVNNAGIGHDALQPERIGKLDFSAWTNCWRTNALGPAMVTDAFIGHVAASDRRLVVGITSEMGCVGRIHTPGDYAYRGSKAALNASFHGMALELERRDVGLLLLHPGWVRTDMGGPSAPLGPVDSVAGMLAVVDGFTPEQSGKLFAHDGHEIPW